MSDDLRNRIWGTLPAGTPDAKATAARIEKVVRGWQDADDHVCVPRSDIENLAVALEPRHAEILRSWIRQYGPGLDEEFQQLCGGDQ